MSEGASPLAALNAYLAARAAARVAALEPEERPEPGELVNARRFRQAWHQHQVTDRVAQAVARRPANAGPLHSHVLVLQSLTLMGELSPGYLRHFLQQVESLQWVERAREAYPRLKPEAKSAGRKNRKAPATR